MAITFPSLPRMLQMYPASHSLCPSKSILLMQWDAPFRVVLQQQHLSIFST